MNFWEVLCPVISGISLKKYQIIKHGGGSVMIGAATRQDSLPESAEGNAKML